VEQRGAGLGERVGETWPDTERIKTLTTRLARFTQREEKASVEDSNWEPDGVTHHVRFCEGPEGNGSMVEILWHRRETRR